MTLITNLRTLPTWERRCLYLCEIGRYSYANIGRLTCTTPGEVARAIYLAREWLISQESKP